MMKGSVFSYLVYMVIIQKSISFIFNVNLGVGW